MFLYGDLQGGIYICEPKGYADKRICELQKTQHGLKQAPKC